jgi:multicomponent Na+:H+ antiporter subunit G
MDLLGDLGPYIADALVILGVAVMTLGVYGLIRMPDIYTKLHASSKAVFLGAITLMVASVATGERDIIMRVILIGAALLITTPIASHVIAHAAAIEHITMVTPGAIDESAYHLVEEEVMHVPVAEAGTLASGVATGAHQRHDRASTGGVEGSSA